LPADPRATCIIGVARRTWHPSDAPDGAPEPLVMWEQVARDAAADTGATDVSSVLGALESIDVVYSQSWQYDDAAARLAERVGASPARRRYSGIGGSVPLVLATEVAREIRAGHLDLALLTGAEALATVRRLKKAGEKPQWSFRPAEKRPFPMDMDFDPSEISHAVFEAYLTFALFDNARRAHLGRDTRTCGAPPPWPRRPERHWPERASERTTWPTSTSTPASPARCASRSMRWGSARTTSVP
jgi:acetyl-CoA C-acetyltransferase